MPEPPEQVEVKRVVREKVTSKPGFWQRHHKAIFPIVGGIILDCADLATYGPIGLYTGMIVGSTVGWVISEYYAYSKKARLVFALLAGVYCSTPGTFFLPLATLSAVFGRKHGGGPRSDQGSQRTAGKKGA